MDPAHPSHNRRTLAIISHPDAGKTTLTEKFLLYGGAIDLAGSVTARRNQQTTASDWMDLERKRGISVSSTVLQFDYRGYRINLLDTPGHEDFSEDTYRVLTAVDAVIMVIDAGKGVEARTRKLFEVCRLRAIPIFTFVNKMDRPARRPIELMDELEDVLGIACYPMNWPLGDGPRFRGLMDRRGGRLHLFERTPRGAFRAPVELMDLHDPQVREHVDELVAAEALDELALLDAAGAQFDEEAISKGRLTPVFFGSAANNFGVQLLLDGFLPRSPGPRGRLSTSGWISPEDERFSAFIFKIQANMNPKHRDKMAFIRIVSGRFERDMPVWHEGSGKEFRLGNSQKLFARERETVEEAWAGDVVGLVGNQPFHIGDTLSSDPEIKFTGIPVFPPECFATIRCANTAKVKAFRAGLDQFVSEGVIQRYELARGHGPEPLLGAIGPLQFEVLKHRLESEYGAKAVIESRPWTRIRWILEAGEYLTGATPPSVRIPSGAGLARDLSGRWALLAESDWTIQSLKHNQPEWHLATSPDAPPSIEAMPGHWTDLPPKDPKN